MKSVFDEGDLSPDLRRCLAVLKGLDGMPTPDVWRDAVKAAGGRSKHNGPAWRKACQRAKDELLQGDYVTLVGGVVSIHE